MSAERELLSEMITSYRGEDFDMYYLIERAEQLLAQPSQEPVGWIETHGKEPGDWEDYEYIWTHWKSGRISLDEAYGCWTWEDITHWMPANIIEPSKPKVAGE